jgi:hypothetical protein
VAVGGGEHTARVTGSGIEGAARSLRDWLGCEHFTDVTSVQATAHLTGSIAAWARQYGYRVQREVRPPGVDSRGRQGRLDLRAVHPAGGRAVSIEIDRGNKRWSLEKLVQAAEHGDIALWVRWSRNSVPLVIPPCVRLLRLGVIRHRGRVTLQEGCCQVVSALPQAEGA